MKTIGMIGGMSWESSLEYYRIINSVIKKRLGGYHSAKIIMYSVDFAEIEALQSAGKWDESGWMLADAAKKLERGGADFMILCTNTMHKLKDDMERAVSMPMLHIADAASAKILSLGIKRVGLLGTRFTMEQDFYKDRLTEGGLSVIILEKEDRDTVHNVIYDELVKGEIKPESREKYKQIIARMAEKGAEGIILGCTEIGLLIKQQDCPTPIFDTTQIHAEAAAEYALK
ncbi:MAG: aspartate/glutamate racemase family protein [Deferribacterales bacterium]